MQAMSARRAVRQQVDTVHLPAPMGGLNTVSPAGAMPEGDCVTMTNLVASELGLRARLGWREWCTGMTEVVRSILPFTGSAKSGAKNRLFACTKNGIYDCTSSSAAPTQMVTFGTVSDDSGWGVCHALVQIAAPNGHYLAYCDEANGYYVYSEALDAWQRVVSATQTAWAATHAYVVGDLVLNGGNVYICTTLGTSAGAGGPTGTSTGIVDNTVRWAYNFSVDGVDPANFVHVTAWKNRLWFTQRDTAYSWFLGLAGLGGTATRQSFGGQFRAGGCLVGLWNWTINGGFGIDNNLVGISSGGDVVIYQGTDPTSANSFGLKGTWSVAGVPAGRRIATEFGGDLLIFSSVGAIPLSLLVSGGDQQLGQYATAKVANLVSLYAQLYGTARGWALRLHPQDNTLLALVPISETAATNQLAMSLASKSWGLYADLPIFSAEAWGGKLYFGTIDGRVCTNEGYVDGVLLATPTIYTPIQWSLLTGFTSMGNGRKKRVQLIRPCILAQSSAPSVSAAARYDFDTSGLAPLSIDGTTPGGWDSGTWDTAVWGGDFSASLPVKGSSGCGSHIAIALRGKAVSRTILTGIDVTYDQGGFL